MDNFVKVIGGESDMPIGGRQAAIYDLASKTLTYQDDITIKTLPGKSISTIPDTAGAVTQGTSTTTGVTLATRTGIITTFASTLAAAGEEKFTVTDTSVALGDIVVACIGTYAGAGTPQVFVSAVAAGSFDLTVANLHASAALNAGMTINFRVIKAA